MNKTKTGAYFYGDESYNFNFTTSLSASDKISFVNSVVNTVVDNNYYTVIRDILFDFSIIRTFTDIDTTFVKNSDSMIDTIEQFLDETNIVDIVKANMEIGLLEELNEAVNKAIEYRTGIHPSPLNDALASLIGTLEKKVNEIDLGGAMEMVKMFNGMAGEFTPESVVNAYMNSDMHKKNVVDIEEAKKSKAEFAESMDKAIKAVTDDSSVKNNTSKKSAKSKK